MAVRGNFSISSIIVTLLVLIGLGCSQRSVETINSPSNANPILGSDDSTQLRLSILHTNPATTIDFCVPAAAMTICGIRNVAGYHVKTLLSAPVDAGCTSVYWDGTNDDGEMVQDGFYNVYLQTGSYHANKVMVVDRDGDGKF